MKQKPVTNPWLVIAAVYFGLLLATGIVATVCWDLYALETGRRTVSDEVYRLGTGLPFVAVVVTGCLAFTSGCLAGHFWFPQAMPTDDKDHPKS